MWQHLCCLLAGFRLFASVLAKILPFWACSLTEPGRSLPDSSFLSCFERQLADQDLTRSARRLGFELRAPNFNTSGPPFGSAVCFLFQAPWLSTLWPAACQLGKPDSYEPSESDTQSWPSWRCSGPVTTHYWVGSLPQRWRGSPICPRLGARSLLVIWTDVDAL